MQYIAKDSIHQRILQSTIAATASAVERARQHGTTLVFWKDGKIVEVDPHTIKLPKKNS